MNRLDSLDWQRGLLALSIMLYHLASWKLRAPDAGELLGRLGIYGVSMFFVLSGLSMAIVYSHFIHDCRSSFTFFVRRIFRIWPLLWLAVLTETIARMVLLKEGFDWVAVALNLTTLFGFVSPGAYINTGAWSIGNEMVYYALTPAIIAAYNRRLLHGNLLLGATLLVGAVFAFAVLDASRLLAQQWQAYIHPFNNLFLYVAGIAIHYNLRGVRVGGHAAAGLVVLGFVLFACYPASGDQIQIVTGSNRVVFALASVIMVAGFYKLKLSLPALLSVPLAQLGVATYGVYLLHPIVYQGVKTIFGRWGGVGTNPWLDITLTVALTVVLALVTFRWLEAPFIRLGKRLTDRPAAATAR